MPILILLPENFLPRSDTPIPPSWILSNTAVMGLMATLSASFMERDIPHVFWAGRSLSHARGLLASGDLQGLISMYRGHTPGEIAGIKGLLGRVPSVSLLTGWRDPTVNYVGLDNPRAISLLVAHLAAEGHRHIAFFGPHVHPSPTLDERLSAWRSEMKKRGLPLPAGYALAMLPGRAKGAAFDTTRFRLALAPWFAGLRPRPDAVLCYSDAHALLMKQHAESLGMRIPDDLSVTGINGSFLDHPRLGEITTIRNHTPLAARAAVKLLFKLIDGKDGRAIPPTQVRIPPELVVGGTSRKKSRLPKEKDRGFLEQVTRFTRENLAHPDPAARAAELSDLSRAHFRLKFARLSGMPYHAHVQNERLAQFASRLAVDMGPIGDLARAVGFHNMSGFNRLFRRRYGMTPRAYRQKAAGGGTG